MKRVIRATSDFNGLIGKPLKEFLKTISMKDYITIAMKSPRTDILPDSKYPYVGYSGLVNSVPWYLADRVVDGISDTMSKVYDYTIYLS